MNQTVCSCLVFFLHCVAPTSPTCTRRVSLLSSHDYDITPPVAPPRTASNTKQQNTKVKSVWFVVATQCVLASLKCLPEGSNSKRGYPCWVGSLMFLALLSEQHDSGGCRQPMILSAVFTSLCSTILSAVERLAYHTRFSQLPVHAVSPEHWGSAVAFVLSWWLLWCHATEVHGEEYALKLKCFHLF